MYDNPDTYNPTPNDTYLARHKGEYLNERNQAKHQEGGACPNWQCFPVEYTQFALHKDW